MRAAYLIIFILALTESRTVEEKEAMQKAIRMRTSCAPKKALLVHACVLSSAHPLLQAAAKGDF